MNKLLQNMAKPYPKSKTFQYQSDNVGEMLDGFQAVVGFAWDDNLHLGSIKYLEWEEPSDWISFRCVCEVLPENGRKNKSTKPKVERDRFGKIISQPNKKTKTKKTTKQAKPKKEKSTKAKKSGGKKNRPESMKKKRRKNG
jgi:hypothetical protein